MKVLGKKLIVIVSVLFAVSAGENSSACAREFEDLYKLRAARVTKDIEIKFSVKMRNKLSEEIRARIIRNIRANEPVGLERMDGSSSTIFEAIYTSDPVPPRIIRFYMKDGEILIVSESKPTMSNETYYYGNLAIVLDRNVKQEFEPKGGFLAGIPITIDPGIIIKIERKHNLSVHKIQAAFESWTLGPVEVKLDALRQGRVAAHEGEIVSYYFVAQVGSEYIKVVVDLLEDETINVVSAFKTTRAKYEEFKHTPKALD